MLPNTSHTGASGAEPLHPPHRGNAGPTRGLQAASVAPAQAVVTATH